MRWGLGRVGRGWVGMRRVGQRQGHVGAQLFPPPAPPSRVRVSCGLAAGETSEASQPALPHPSAPKVAARPIPPSLEWWGVVRGQWEWEAAGGGGTPGGVSQQGQHMRRTGKAACIVS